MALAVSMVASKTQQHAFTVSYSLKER